MNLRQIEAFRAVMVAGTVTGAASRLRISQPAVSRLISQLERTTKLVLFVRSKQRVHPTPEALAFYHEVERAFVGIDRLERAAANIRNLVTGNLRIVSLPALGLGFLPHVIKRYRDMYPKVTVSLQTRSSSTVMDWITALQFDLGLASNTIEKPSIKASLFAASEAVCILPPNHGLAAKSVITPKDLAGEHFVSLSMEDQARFQIDHVFAEARVERQLSLETPYAATACAMVMEGLGVSVISPFPAEDFRGQGLLIKRFRPAIHFRTMLLQPAERPASLVAEKFISLMEQCRDELLERHNTALRELEPCGRAVSLIAV
jgi:DNA-binding transcriptional LysR family regulator